MKFKMISAILAVAFLSAGTCFSLFSLPEFGPKEVQP
jgi:hypothetical protein